MPELPEVETIRRDLEKKILGKRIFKVEVKDQRSLQGKSVAKFKKELIGNEFIDIDRRGKLLIFKFSLPSGEGNEGCVKRASKFLLIHLKMTGQLLYMTRDSDNMMQVTAGGHSDKKINLKLPNSHTRIIFEFFDKSKLYFNDLRVFGYLKIVDEKKLREIEAKFGVEPLSLGLTLGLILGIMKNKKTSIKAFLLNQKNIAGIGNIYADEICFASGIRPSRKLDSLSDEEKRRIFKNTRKILKLAVEKRGTTFNLSLIHI